MSAADPAQPVPGLDRGPGTVVRLFRGRRSPARPGRAQEGIPADRGESSPQERLADSAEKLFLKHDRTLTDPDTQEVYLITLKLVAGLFEGARVNGVVDDGQHRELHAIINGLRSAPDLL